jgi:AcrR family transcriptional regulator
MSETLSLTRRDQRREAILKVAQEVFFEEGYAAASMSTIAARLGGSKGTLYNYFKSKDELFKAYVQDACAKVAEDAFDRLSNDEDPVEAVLQRLGEVLIAHICSDWAVRNFRLIVTESKRAPELARIFYDAGPAMGRERLADFFERAAARGALRITNVTRAVDHFFALCKGDSHFRLIMNLTDPPSAEKIRSDVAAAIEVFMAAYGPQSRGASPQS